MTVIQIEPPSPNGQAFDDPTSTRHIENKYKDVEDIILQHPGVKEVALLRHQEGDRSFLVAYLVADLKADRIHWESECRVQIQDGPCINLKTVDLSANGVGLRDIPHFFKTGKEVRCTLQLPTKGLIRDTAKVLPISVSFKGSIAWCNTTNKRAGILFHPTREQKYLLTQSVKLLSETQGIEVADLRHDEPRIPLSSSCLVEFEQGPIVQLITENVSPDGVRLLAKQKKLWQVGQRLHLCLQLPTEERVLPSFDSAEQNSTEESDNEDPDYMVTETSLWLKGQVLWYYEDRAGIQFDTTEETKALVQKSIEYMTANQGYSLAHLRQYLTQTLPPEMIPTTFVLMEALPRTLKGELDNDALPLSSQIRQRSKSNYVAPYTDLQWQLSKIWEYAFDVRPIGVKDNFFELGGTPMTALRISNEAKKLIHQHLPSIVLFNAPTIELLSNLLEDKELLQTIIQKTIIPIQPLGEKPPFFLVPARSDNVLHFASMTSYLTPDQPLYALPFNLEGTMEASIEQIAAAKIKQIQMVQPTGPYFLGGYCAGSVIAYEMAQQLRAQKQKVAFLALIASHGVDLPSTFRREVENNIGQAKTSEHQGEEIASIRERMQDLWSGQIWENVWRVGYKLHQATGRPLPHFFHDITQLNHELLKNYQPQPYPDPITLFQPAKQLINDSHTESLMWGTVAKQVTSHTIPGDTSTIWQEPNIQIFAEKLRDCIQMA